MFVDADDWLMDNMLEKINEAIEHSPDVQLVQFNLKTLLANGQTRAIGCPEDKTFNIHDNGYFSNLVVHTQSKAVKLKLLNDNRIRFYEKIDWQEDKLFWLQTALAAERYVNIAQQLYTYDKNFSTLTKKENMTNEKFYWFYKEYLGVIGKY